MNNTLIIITVAWLLIGIIHHGLSFAYFQRKYELIAERSYWSDWWFSFAMSWLGPLALTAYFITSRSSSFKYGFKLW